MQHATCVGITYVLMHNGVITIHLCSKCTLAYQYANVISKEKGLGAMMDIYPVTITFAQMQMDVRVT